MGWETTLAWSTAQARAKIITKIRLFFAARNVIEVDTPLLSNGTITDAHIEAFDTRYNFLSDTLLLFDDNLLSNFLLFQIFSIWICYNATFSFLSFYLFLKRIYLFLINTF